MPTATELLAAAIKEARRWGGAWTDAQTRGIARYVDAVATDKTTHISIVVREGWVTVHHAVDNFAHRSPSVSINAAGVAHTRTNDGASVRGAAAWRFLRSTTAN